MKNQFKFLLTAFLAVLLMVACEKEQVQPNNNELIESSASSRGEKVTICHNGHTIRVSENALKAHLNHGDSEGECGSGGGDDGDDGGDDDGGDGGGDTGDGGDDGGAGSGDPEAPPVKTTKILEKSDRYQKGTE